jgi:hypothetical protein
VWEHSPESHHGGKRVGVATDVVEEVIRSVEDVIQHLLVLKHLVWNICLRGRDVEDAVNELSEFSPVRTIALERISK